MPHSINGVAIGTPQNAQAAAYTQQLVNRRRKRKQPGQKPNMVGPTDNAAPVGRPPASTMPRKGPVGSLRDFKGPHSFNQTHAQGKQIGFYNATHKHGEPMKGLLAALKSRRGKGSRQRI